MNSPFQVFASVGANSLTSTVWSASTSPFNVNVSIAVVPLAFFAGCSLPYPPLPSFNVGFHTLSYRVNVTVVGLLPSTLLLSSQILVTLTTSVSGVNSFLTPTT